MRKKTERLKKKSYAGTVLIKKFEEDPKAQREESSSASGYG